MIPIATKIADRLHIRSYFDILIRKARAGIVRDKRKVIYFTDELHEEFSITDITPRVIGDDYCYEPKGVWKRITRFFWYRIVATPCAYLYVKVFFRHRVTGRKKFKAFRRHGYFLYGNHTQDWADAFIPSIINFPQQDFVIVHPNNPMSARSRRRWVLCRCRIPRRRDFISCVPCHIKLPRVIPS